MASDSSPSRQSGLITWLAVAAFFLIWSLLHVAIPGVNEPHYLGKARAYSDPDWCAGDFFLHSANAHAVFFNIAGPLTQIWSLAAVAVAGRVVSALILGWGWCRLCASMEFSRSETVRSAALLGAIALSGNLSGEWILGGFESKVPAFGFAFFAVGTWMTCSDVSRLRCWIIAGVCAGAAMSLHPVVGGWFVIGMGMATITETILTRWRTPPSERSPPGRSAVALIAMTLAALATALPGLIPALRMLSASTLPPASRAAADRIQVFVRLKHHLDPTHFPANAWIHAGVLLLLTLAGYWWLRKSTYRHMQNRILSLLTAAVVIAIVGVAIGWHRGPVVDLPDWSWRASLLKFYPFRFLDALLPVTASLVLVAVVAESGAAVLLRSQWTAGLILLVLAAAFVSRESTPSGYTASGYAEWRDACAWIRDNVPDEGTVLTPRESFAFKWLAERPEYVCYKDCPQDAEGILEWYRRLHSVAWLNQYSPQPPLSPADVQRLRSETGVTHLITRRLKVLHAEPAFENSAWRIYEVGKSDTLSEDR